jgi:hypothetical protein
MSTKGVEGVSKSISWTGDISSTGWFTLAVALGGSVTMAAFTSTNWNFLTRTFLLVAGGVGEGLRGQRVCYTCQLTYIKLYNEIVLS